MTKLIRICILTVKTVFCKAAVLALSRQMQMFGVLYLACPLSIFPLCLGIQSMMWDWKWLWKEHDWCLESVSEFASLLLQDAWCAQGVILLLAPIQCSPASLLCQSRLEPTLKSFRKFRDIEGVQGISFPIRDSGLMLWLHLMPGWGTVCCLMRSKGRTSSWSAWYWQEITPTKGKKPHFGHAWR